MILEKQSIRSGCVAANGNAVEKYTASASTIRSIQHGNVRRHRLAGCFMQLIDHRSSYDYFRTIRFLSYRFV